MVFAHTGRARILIGFSLPEPASGVLAISIALEGLTPIFTFILVAFNCSLRRIKLVEWVLFLDWERH
ncbi:hypothetical protein BDV24DRAFT_140673 [Aspergillus arachidicola]|uniref:Uncharacterized protein n=1 Tax=Aspergillus arachidicola TaxID=656916 RepID=A0A5N6XV28_9EURO|nr:hypothetical protein BDV24DRAFT_140673 [Aspergillus arachidicola]